MAEDGDEKLLRTVQHIVQTLGSSDTMTEDILNVFSNYDGRLSLDKIYAARGAAAAAGGGGGGGERSMPASPPLPPPPQRAVSSGSSATSTERAVRALDRQISQYVTMDRLIWADLGDANAFLEAVDDLIGTVQELDAATALSSGHNYKDARSKKRNYNRGPTFYTKDPDTLTGNAIKTLATIAIARHEAAAAASNHSGDETTWRGSDEERDHRTPEDPPQEEERTKATPLPWRGETTKAADNSDTNSLPLMNSTESGEQNSSRRCRSSPPTQSSATRATRSRGEKTNPSATAALC